LEHTHTDRTGVTIMNKVRVGSRCNIVEDKADDDCRVLVAYHAHCIDGYTAAWACWRGLTATTSIFNHNIHFQEMAYNSLEGVVARARDYDKIYFVDFSVPPATLLTLAEGLEVSVVILDHHKTAIEQYASELPGYYSKKAEILFALEECGASLVWSYFFPDSVVPRLIQYVRDYDLWTFQMQETRGINKYLRLQKKVLPVWQKLEAEFNMTGSLAKIRAIGSQLEKYHQSIVADLVAQAEPCWIEGKAGLVVNCSPQFSSDVGHELAKLSGTYGATWQQEPGRKVKWSLRSNGNYDVSAIATAFNGGGHKNAAGFYLSVPTDDVTKLGVILWSGSTPTEE